MEENNLQPDLEQLKKQNEEYLLGWKRAMADYQNLKKETEKERISSLKYGAQVVILSLLPAFDHFNDAAAHIPKEDENKAWVQGIFLIKKELDEALKQFGLEVMECVGEKFDPGRHEAVGEEESKEVEPGIIIKQIQNGYTQNGEIMRPAKVIISK